jgi:N-acetylglucosaminyldiphosphoundecaprenol N-acetyl-beta-D-mannosaminyltransferase
MTVSAWRMFAFGLGEVSEGDQVSSAKPPGTKGQTVLNADANGSRFRVLGVPVDAVQMPDVIQRMERWILQRDASRYIAVTSVHGVIESQQDGTFKQTLDSADMVIPDGMPLVWFGRRNGFDMPKRVCGADLFEEFCRATHTKGYTHFLYGGAAGVPEALAEVLERRFPGVRIAGTYSPPFRPLTVEEDRQALEMINRSAADVLWVGLGCPKQERWMYEHRHRLTVPVVVGVGAAFDFLSGGSPRVPRVMGDHGLEWIYRLWKEPRRLWRRHLIIYSSLVYYWFREIFGIARSTWQSKIGE